MGDAAHVDSSVGGHPLPLRIIVCRHIEGDSPTRQDGILAPNGKVPEGIETCESNGAEQRLYDEREIDHYYQMG